MRGGYMAVTSDPCGARPLLRCLWRLQRIPAVSGHELALVVSLFGVRVERVLAVHLDADSSELIELGNGASDWAKLRFRIELDGSAPPPNTEVQPRP